MSDRRPSTSASAPGAGMVPSTIAAVCGLLFALCLFLSVSTVSPVENETDDGLLAEWAQSSLRQDFVLSMTFQIVAAIAFLVFSLKSATVWRRRHPRIRGADWSTPPALPSWACSVFQRLCVGRWRLTSRYAISRSPAQTRCVWLPR